jgi:hypothetical protein
LTSVIQSAIGWVRREPTGILAVRGVGHSGPAGEAIRGLLKTFGEMFGTRVGGFRRWAKRPLSALRQPTNGEFCL